MWHRWNRFFLFLFLIDGFKILNFLGYYFILYIILLWNFRVRCSILLIIDPWRHTRLSHWAYNASLHLGLIFIQVCSILKLSIVINRTLRVSIFIIWIFGRWENNFSRTIYESNRFLQIGYKITGFWKRHLRNFA